MRNGRTMLISVGVCVSVLLNGVRAQNASERRKRDESGVIVQLGALRVTNTMVELRCEIQNTTSEDIWIYGEPTHARSLNGARPLTAHAFVDKDNQTLIIAGRINLPYRGPVWAHVRTPYARLPQGQSQAKVLLVRLPIILDQSDEQGFFQIFDQGVDHLVVSA